MAGSLCKLAGAQTEFRLVDLRSKGRTVVCMSDYTETSWKPYEIRDVFLMESLRRVNLLGLVHDPLGDTICK